MAKKVIVLKFGGTSVSTTEGRQLVVEHVKRVKSEGYFPVLVISAMGRRGAPYATDTLIDLIRAEGEPVDGRDEDLIYHCGEVISCAIMSHRLKLNGHPAVALTGGQAGIFTEECSRRAKILRIDPTRMLAHVGKGEIPVVTGGQGVGAVSQDVTILGRGASDTSGVAVGVALGAERAEIYSDVHGVAVADPRVVSGANFLKEITYQKMYEMSVFGSKVLHPGAVLIGQRGGMEIVCRSTFDQAPGTSIKVTQNEPDLVGIASMSPVCLIRVSGAASRSIQPEDLYNQFAAVLISQGNEPMATIAVSTDWKPALLKWLSDQGASVTSSRPDWGVVSLIGQPDFIVSSFQRAKTILVDQSIETPIQERASIRSSFVVGKDATQKAVQSFYAAFIKPSRGYQ
ncbi:MAG: aspartate kinase [Thermoleophilia bacterium]